MSSRVLPAGEKQGAAAVNWRRVESPHRGRVPPFADAPPSPEPARAESASAQSDPEECVREARAAGFREGEAAGRKAAGAELQPVIERLSRSIEEIGGLRARLRRESEADLVHLSLAIARRILMRELAVDPDALHGLIVGALEKLQVQEICRVRVHPSHAALVSGCLRQAVAGRAVEVIPDASREPGAVIFETERGSLDASVESQLREIERGLADRLRSAR